MRKRKRARSRIATGVAIPTAITEALECLSDACSVDVGAGTGTGVAVADLLVAVRTS